MTFGSQVCQLCSGFQIMIFASLQEIAVKLVLYILICRWIVRFTWHSQLVCFKWYEFTSPAAMISFLWVTFNYSPLSTRFLCHSSPCHVRPIWGVIDRLASHIWCVHYIFQSEVLKQARRGADACTRWCNKWSQPHLIAFWGTAIKELHYACEQARMTLMFDCSAHDIGTTL